MSKSPLLASDANRWVECNGAPSLARQFPEIVDEDGKQSRLDGRAFHEVGQRILESFRDPNGELVSKPHILGTQSADGVVITDEIYDAALVYSNDVLATCKGPVSMKDLHIEERVELDCIYPDHYGFVDAWVFDKSTMTLTVWEGKFGHRFVEVFENWQLTQYVAGILDTLNVNGFMDQQITVVMKIIQPRCFDVRGTIRHWTVKASDLRAQINTVIMAAWASIEPNAKCKTGPQCNTCGSRYGCTTLQRGSYVAMEYVHETGGVSLSGNNLAFELRMLTRAEELIKARKSGLEMQALAEVRSGTLIPGYSAVQGYGNKRWRKDTPVDEVIAMGDMMGLDLRKPVTLDTPAQSLQKGLDDSVIDAYSETPRTKMKLVEDNGSKARQVFKPQ